MWDVSDVHNDIKEHFSVVGSSLSRRIRGRGAYQQTWGNVNERTSLLPDQVIPTAHSAPASSFSGYSSDPGYIDNQLGSIEVLSEPHTSGNNVIT